LAVLAAAGALTSVLYALDHSGPASFFSRAADKPDKKDDDDDPNQVDTIVIGDPNEAPLPAKPGEHPSPVHPTILIHLPRSGDRMGLLPDSPAGHLLYEWLAAFNRASYQGLENALPNIAADSTAEVQMELRRQTGGYNLLSAKEVVPGVLVFRMRDQTPRGVEVLGTLQVRPNSKPATIASFSLRAVPAASPAAPTSTQPAVTALPK
jgi:hypothetical protein